MERIKGFIDPTTPEGYLEAAMRLCEKAMEYWERLPDGDGEHGTPDDENQTKTDMLMIIQGCASYGLDCLKLKAMVDQI